MTPATMILYFRDYVHDTAGTGFTDAEVERLLTRAQNKLIDEAPLDETSAPLTILGGADSVALPADFMSSSIPGVSTGAVVLRQAARRDFPATSQKRRATPLFFCVFGRTIEIESIVENDTIFDVTYARRPSAITAAGAEPAYDPESHDHMPHFAAALALTAQGRSVDAALHLAEAAEIRRRASRAYEARHAARRRRGETTGPARLA